MSSQTPPTLLQRESAQKANEANQHVSEAGRMRDDLGRQLQNARDRQEPGQRALEDARAAIAEHDRQVCGPLFLLSRCLFLYDCDQY